MVNRVKPEKLQFIYTYMKWKYLLVTVEWVLWKLEFLWITVCSPAEIYLYALHI